MDLRRDDISLILPINESSTKSTSTRKSLKRRWNQLSRFQKNLLFTALAAFLVTIFFLLPNDEAESDKLKPRDTGKDKVDAEHIQISPYAVKQFVPNIPDNLLNENTETGNVDDKSSIIETAAVANNAPMDSDRNSKPLPNNKNLLNNNINNLNNNVKRNLVESNVEKSIDNQNDGDTAGGAAAAAQDQDEPTNDGGGVEFKGPVSERQRAVVEAFKHSWKGYKEYAWGHDNLKPMSLSYHDWFGLGLTLIDSLDTMYIMDLQDDFDEARNWVEQYLRFDKNLEVNLFEVTIRVLGGLLSTYHLSGDKMFLTKATELGDRLLPCFDSPSQIPYSDVNLATMKAHSPKWSPDSSTSEVTTIQLEFRDLSRSTGNPVYERVAHNVNIKVHDLEKNEGLVPIFINANTGMFRNFATISLGARADSYYEYLVKQWLQMGKQPDDFLIEDYKTSIQGVLHQLVRKTPNEHHVYIGELINGKDFKPKMDHLTCYLPGTLLLGYHNGMPESHRTLAHDLLETCFQTYMKQPTQLAPEITYFNLNGENENDIYVKSNDAHNLLRPEFIESLFYFYAITGNKTYQDMGWTIFQAFNKYTRVKNGYTSIGNVKSPLNTRPRDMMESFWLGETLKYFYLLFSDDRKEVDISKYLFNSEAHLIPIRNEATLGDSGV